jgi:hypothetical protein
LPEGIARQDAHRTAHGDRRLRAVIGQVERELRSTVAHADDEHAVAAIGLRGAVRGASWIVPLNASWPGHVGTMGVRL